MYFLIKTLVLLCKLSNLFHYNINKQKKKDNVNQHTVVLLQLTAIPGISTKKATEIINVHNITSISDLCDKMKVAKPKDFFKTVHGIGKVLQSSIYVFCGVDPGSS